MPGPEDEVRSRNGAINCVSQFSTPASSQHSQRLAIELRSRPKQSGVFSVCETACGKPSRMLLWDQPVQAKRAKLRQVRI